MGGVHETGPPLTVPPVHLTARSLQEEVQDVLVRSSSGEVESSLGPGAAHNINISSVGEEEADDGGEAQTGRQLERSQTGLVQH